MDPELRRRRSARFQALAEQAMSRGTHAANDDGHAEADHHADRD